MESWAVADGLAEESGKICTVCDSTESVIEQAPAFLEQTAVWRRVGCPAVDTVDPEHKPWEQGGRLT